MVATSLSIVALLSACSGQSNEASTTEYRNPKGTEQRPLATLPSQTNGKSPLGNPGSIASDTNAPIEPPAGEAAAETEAAAYGQPNAQPSEQASGQTQDAARKSRTPAPITPEYSEPEPVTRPNVSAQPPQPSIKSRDAGVNPRETTSFDRFSTFALDVDTSSYTLSRSLVDAGTLPSFESVRTEEFVNYFNQDYPSPTNNDTFAIHVDGATAPFLQSNQRIVRVGIQAERIDRADRSAAHLTFVIDVSGSMEENNKLNLVKDSLRQLVNNLRADDTIAIVAFSDDARVVLGPTSAEASPRILAAIDSLQTEGGTNAEAGLVLAYDVAERMRADNRSVEGTYQPINRVILASDGVANVGANGPEAILDRIRAAATSGIDLVTIGVGTASYNDEMMERLADGGNGFSAYVDAPFEADRLFRERLVSTLQTVARDAKVQVEFNPDVVSDYRLIGFENRAVADSDFRNDKVDAGEIGAGHSVTALYEVTLRDERRNDDMATVKLRWDDVRKNKVIEMKEKVKTSDVSTPLVNANPRLGLSITVAAYAEVLRQGPWYRVTSLRDLAEQSRRLETPLAGDPDVKEFIRLLDRAATL